jgi:hypothetical protein
MSPTLLQIFLLINVFLIGALLAVAVQHAYAHFRPHPPEPPKGHPDQSAHLPVAIRKRLLEVSQTKFQAVLDRSADELQHDLSATAKRLTQQLEKFGNEIITDEMTRYRASLETLRQQTADSMGAAQNAIVDHQTEMTAKLAARQTELEAQLSTDMAAEKQRLIEQMDTKLADAVASFLLETLPHNVDLGAQSAYLTTMLETHKDELTKGVSHEA